MTLKTFNKRQNLFHNRKPQTVLNLMFFLGKNANLQNSLITFKNSEKLKYVDNSEQGNTVSNIGGNNGLIGDAPTIVVTPKSKPPNVIPFNERGNLLQGQLQGKKHIVHPEERGDKGEDDNSQMAIKTPQQILREKIFGNNKQGCSTIHQSS